MPALQRCAAVFRYSVLRLEFWTSPGGGLRNWLRLNVGFALLIGIPAVVLVPIISILLGQFTHWSHSLVEIAENLLQFLLLSWVVVAFVTALPCFRRKSGRK